LQDFRKGWALSTRDRRYGNVDLASLLNDDNRSGGLSREKAGGEQEDGEDEFHRERQEHGGQSASEIFAFNKRGYSKAINSVTLKQKYELFLFNTRTKIIVLMRKTKTKGDTKK